MSVYQQYRSNNIIKDHCQESVCIITVFYCPLLLKCQVRCTCNQTQQWCQSVLTLPGVHFYVYILAEEKLNHWLTVWNVCMHLFINQCSSPDDWISHANMFSNFSRTQNQSTSMFYILLFPYEMLEEANKHQASETTQPLYSACWPFHLATVCCCIYTSTWPPHTRMAVDAIWRWCSRRRVLSLSVK